MFSIYFTVFTPTYNRAHTLHRVYQSLLNQTIRDFEWLIVDDGSTDNTRELIQGWQAEAPFLIRYIYQKNRGKHIATNVAVKQARGELFLIFDSDDICVPESLERFKFYWEQIPEKQREEYSTLSVTCTDLHGGVIGGEFPRFVVDTDSVQQQIILRSSGERWGVNRTEILKKFPFPEIVGENFISEGIVWNRLSLRYRARFVNEKLRICNYQVNGLSANSIRNRATNPVGARLYYNELSRLPISIITRIRAQINYIRFSFHGKFSVKDIIKDSIEPFAAMILLPLGYVMFKRDNKIL